MESPDWWVGLGRRRGSGAVSRGHRKWRGKTPPGGGRDPLWVIGLEERPLAHWRTRKCKMLLCLTMSLFSGCIWVLIPRGHRGLRSTSLVHRCFSYGGVGAVCGLFGGLIRHERSGV
ncbi:hypothetical protein TNIN_498241 [Trichonephila inaurata madagascariensis]|uniref:Uncharacterized protein n=1 Tax=Trichonephila inaurata madagascariensis TaxID=2747483 RepID=A0A8X6WTS9_9ARAC|nr:hypothetical protein TNIN_498241 [Trichonephila inaurata madagascariensis]